MEYDSEIYINKLIFVNNIINNGAINKTINGS